jgi:hypothetical protein
MPGVFDREMNDSATRRRRLKVIQEVSFEKDYDPCLAYVLGRSKSGFIRIQVLRLGLLVLYNSANAQNTYRSIMEGASNRSAQICSCCIQPCLMIERL